MFGDVNTTAAAMDPPAYDDIASATINVSAFQTPATFHIIGNSIYSDKSVNNEPLYKLSRDIGTLRDTTRTMTIERIDRISKGNQGTSQLVTHKRHLYDLKHPAILTQPLFLYHADSVSKYSLCSLGINTFRPGRFLSSARGYQVHRVVKNANHGSVPRGHLFSAVSTKRGEVRFEWCDPGGQIVARELDSPLARYNLFVTMEMNEMARDALVSAWVLRVWWEVAEMSSYEL